MPKLCRILPALLLVLLVAACDDKGQSAINRGLAAYKAKQYHVAYKEWLPVAKGGNAEAQYHIGRLFANGRGVKKDDAVANGWYRKAAEQGHANAQYRLASQMNYGYGFSRDRDQDALEKEAARWFRAAAEQGHAKAQGMLGWYYQIGRGVPKNIEESLKWLRKGAEQNDNFSLYNLAQHQSDDGSPHGAGVGVATDDEAAVRNYLKAARNGDYWSAQNLERLFNQGRTSLSDRDIVELFEHMVRKGRSPAYAHLAGIYLEGRLTERDPAKAVPLLEGAAKYGFTRHYGAYQLAKLYLAGDGVPRNTSKAAGLLIGPADGTPEARLILAFLHANGDGVRQDLAQAYYWASLAMDAPRAKDISERAVRARAYFESRMSADDKSRGKDLLRQRWATVHENRKRSEERAIAKLEGGSVPAGIPMGREGLERLMSSGNLRRADRQDIELWQAAAGETARNKPSALARIPTDRIYVVVSPIVLPDGLIGSEAVTFLLATGASTPTGPRGDNLFYSMSDFTCHPRCGMPYRNVPKK